MLFNSIDFAIFFAFVFTIYWTLISKLALRYQNAFLLGVSYLFYGWWDYRFLSLIIISSAIDYTLGLKIHKEEKPPRRKLLLGLSLISNLGILGFFKYFDFFLDSFESAFTFLGADIDIGRLNVILPVGISFYTFQTLSYTIDIYRKNLEPTGNPLTFFAFVSFFPQLVAGPIERATNLLPQFEMQKSFDYHRARSGFLLALWGLFLKVVIADRLAIFINNVYGSVDDTTGVSLVIAIVFFAFQLYIDFYAYSIIAIGIARSIGFDLMTNFRRPYLATSFSAFWQRWHISLSTWFRDYLYIPLGGSKGSSLLTKRNVLIVFIVSGLWHGASWNFVIWGLINGLFLILLNKILGKILPIKKLISPILIFSLWAISLVFFRAVTFSDALTIFSKLGLRDVALIYDHGLNSLELKLSIALIAGLMLFEILQEKVPDLAERFYRSFFLLRWAVYLSLLLAITFMGSYGENASDNSFIYFQF